VTHPHVLHAEAALWSLRCARQLLADQVDREAADNGAQLLAAAPILTSPTWGTRHAVGGHGDPTGLLVLGELSTRVTTWSERAHRLGRRLGWLADQVDGGGRGDPLARIATLIGASAARSAPVVAIVARHLADEDRWIRDALALDPEETVLPGTQCPACGHRPLRALPTGRAGGVVVCRPGCTCSGEGCGCGMPVLAPGVGHIWATSALAEVALVRSAA
jgi:hypothetical protein